MSTLEISANMKKLPIKPDMLVVDAEGNLSLVTKVTRKWVHAVILILTDSSLVKENEMNYHHEVLYARSEVLPAPAGTSLVLKQRAI